MRKATVCIVARNEILRDLIKAHLGGCESLRVVERPDEAEIEAVVMEQPLLSPSEIEILQHLARYGRVEKVARILHRSPRTIYRVLANIREKLGVRSTLQAVRWAIELGLLKTSE